MHDQKQKPKITENSLFDLIFLTVTVTVTVGSESHPLASTQHDSFSHIASHQTQGRHTVVQRSPLGWDESVDPSG